jgi:hypothetical protein
MAALLFVLLPMTVLGAPVSIDTAGSVAKGFFIPY